MEIVLSVGFTDVIFRRERSDNRKYVCRSHASIVCTLLTALPILVNGPFLKYVAIKLLTP